MQFSWRRALLAALAGLAGHALAVGAGFLAGQLVEPTSGGGFEDLGAIIVTFVGTEIVVALACVVTGLVLLARGRRDAGFGLLAGWAAGAVLIWLLLFLPQA